MILKETIYRLVCCALIVLSVTSSSTAQELIDTSSQSTESKKVNIKSAENMVHSRIDGNEIDSLRGDIRLYQDSTFMFCDTAIIFNKEHLVAYGNVIIMQNDTIQTYCDSLSYDATSKEAELFGEVILLNGNEKLNTTYLKYNLNRKEANFTNGGILSKNNTKLSSVRGKYFVNEKVAYFANDVKIIDDDLNVITDTLKYELEEEKANFIGPTRIVNKEANIYCESGYYIVPKKEALFEQSAQYIKEATKATAEQIFYYGESGDVILEGDAKFFENDKEATAIKIVYNENNETTFLKGDAYYKDNEKEVTADAITYDAATEAVTTEGITEILEENTKLVAAGMEYNDSLDMGHAFGDVIWEDYSKGIKIYCEDMYYRDEDNYVKAFGNEERPRLESVMAGDTLFLVADTLISTSLTDSLGTKDLFNAYENVKIFKQDLQAVCDSLSYNVSDSLFVLYDDPILWSDTTQMTGDTITIILKDQQIEALEIMNNGFVINENSDAVFNQMKGKKVHANFSGGKLTDMILEGNSESIYFLQDDFDAYIGMNKSLCSKIKVIFSDEKMSDLKFLSNPQSTMTPLSQLSEPDMQLEGFRWFTENRPLSIFDLN